jgi:hypothetical protein
MEYDLSDHRRNEKREKGNARCFFSTPRCVELASIIERLPAARSSTL